MKIALTILFAFWISAARSRSQIPPKEGEMLVRAEFAGSQTNAIQSVLSQARDGETIFVQGPGVFHERVVVLKSIRLVGLNLPVIDADFSGTPVSIIASNVELRGFVIRNSGRDLGAADSGILISGNKTTVRDCRVEGDAFGIYIRGANDCVIERNEIFGDAKVSSAARGNGIHLWNTKRNRLLANVIHDKRDGMYFSYADENVIGGNRVFETRFGIHYMYSHRNQLLTNSLTRNVVGATLMFSRDSLVEGNFVAENRRHGMVFKQLDNSRVLNNIVAGQNRGFFIQQANKNRFEGNLVATNDIGLYLSNSSEENVFVGNAFVRNADQVWQPPFETEQGRQGPNAFSEHGRGNFWSDYVGTDRNHDGIGDTPYHETDVFGYILDRHPEARIFALSPAVALLRKSEELMPLMNATGVTDLAPLMTMENRNPETRIPKNIRNAKSENRPGAVNISANNVSSSPISTH
ncbi:MAG TPA: nitrous oxide reductase family maturation protein NosD [Verrucomicrobiae bacterium]|nr:nitrous oxide reductase family maturation protein NosD [Verrucomicrobiae bacterium]